MVFDYSPVNFFGCKYPCPFGRRCYIAEKDADRVNQNHKSSRGTDSPALSSLLQDKKKLAIVIAGVVAVLVIIGVVAALWPAGSDAPADADASSAWS